MIAQLSHYVTLTSRLLGVVAAGLLLLGCIVICQSVALRYLFEASTVWQTEFVKYAIVAATLLGSPYVLFIGGHVGVDLLSPMLGSRGQKFQRIVAGLIALVFCIVLAWGSWRYFYEAWRNNWVTESVWAPPLWLILMPLPLGIGLLCLQMIVELARPEQRS